MFMRKTGVRVSTNYNAANLRAKALELAIMAAPMIFSGTHGPIAGTALFDEAEVIEARLKKARDV